MKPYTVTIEITTQEQHDLLQKIIAEGNQTDDEGWIPNPGYQPVDGDVLVDTKCKKDGEWRGFRAKAWVWENNGLTHYRISK